MHASSGIEFVLYALNEEGSIGDLNTPLRTFILPCTEIFEILRTSCSSRFVPLVACDCDEKDQIELGLEVSHRIEPKSVRQSVESNGGGNSGNSSLRYSVSSVENSNSNTLSGSGAPIPLQLGQQQPLLDFRAREVVIFDVVVEEARGLLHDDEITTRSDTILAFCGCSAGYIQDIDSLSYSVGPESCVTAVVPFDSKVLSWKDSISRIEIPLLSTNDRKSLIKKLSVESISVF